MSDEEIATVRASLMAAISTDDVAVAAKLADTALNPNERQKILATAGSRPMAAAG